MDTFAKGLIVADQLLQDKALESFVEERYASYNEGIGKDIVQNKVGFEELTAYALKHDKVVNKSGRQEMLEDIVNRYIYS